MISRGFANRFSNRRVEKRTQPALKICSARDCHQVSDGQDIPDFERSHSSFMGAIRLMVNCSENLRAGTIASEEADRTVPASTLHSSFMGSHKAHSELSVYPSEQDAGQFRDEGISGNGLARGPAGMVILDHTFQRHSAALIRSMRSFRSAGSPRIPASRKTVTAAIGDGVNDFPAFIGVKTVRKGFAQRGKRFFRREECLQNTIHELRFALIAKGLGR